MGRAILIFILIVAFMLGLLMAFRRFRSPPPPADYKPHYDDWEKEDEKRGWKDPEK